jgi:hypothetical protein
MVLASVPSVDLTAGATQMVSISVKIPTDATELAPSVKLDLASSLPTEHIASTFTVKKQLTITFDAGTGMTSPHSSLPAIGTPIKVQSGTLLIFHNGDTIQHIVHGDAGIPHEDQINGGQPGGNYMVTITADGDFYCHDHEGSAQARVFNVL